MWLGNDRHPALIPFFKAVKHTFPHCAASPLISGSAYSRGTPEFWLSLIYLDVTQQQHLKSFPRCHRDIQNCCHFQLSCVTNALLSALAACERRAYIYNFPQITFRSWAPAHTHVTLTDWRKFLSVSSRAVTCVCYYRMGKVIWSARGTMGALRALFSVCVSSSVCH